MKRSEINRALRDMEKMIDRCSFKLPPFCYFTPEEWNEKGHESGVPDCAAAILQSDTAGVAGHEP